MKELLTWAFVLPLPSDDGWFIFPAMGDSTSFPELGDSFEAPRVLNLRDGTLLDFCRKRYKTEHHHIRFNHFNGANAVGVAHARAALIDGLIQSIGDVVSRSRVSRDSSANRAVQSFSVVALGEYGSLELAPFSPAEILFLCKPSAKDVGDDLQSEILEILKVCGIECQPQFLASKECLQRSQADPAFCLSMISARLVLGDLAGFAEMQQKLLATVVKNLPAFANDLCGYLSNLHQEHGASPYQLESDVELGAGGVLDCRVLRSLVMVSTGNALPNGLILRGEVTSAEWKKFVVSWSYLLRLRNHLQFITGKRWSVLSFELMDPVAKFWGYKEGRRMKASARFLRDTLLHRQLIHTLLMRTLLNNKNKLDPEGQDSRFRYLKLASKFSSSEVGQGPERWLRILPFIQGPAPGIRESVREGLRVSLSGWTPAAFDSMAVHEAFLGLLKAKGKVGPALRMLRDLGFLGKYLPEFERLDCFPVLDGLHSCSLDELTLRTIELLDDLVNSEGPEFHDYQRVLEQVDDPSLIYLALLLLNTGKVGGSREQSRSERHAAMALRRMKLNPESLEKVLLLVREYQLLSHASQRRDIDDPLLIQELSASLETAANLNMLLLVTHVDGKTRGHQAWTERKESLLWSLYFKIFDRLLLGDDITEPEHARVALMQQKVLESLETEIETEAVLHHFMLLPEKYAIYTPLPQIQVHIRLCERLGGSPVVTEWIPHPHAGYTELYLSTRDMPGRFAQIAGCLASNGVSILSAQLNTRADGLVIDTFQVGDLQGQAILDTQLWGNIEQMLAGVISGAVSMESLLESRLAALPNPAPAASVVPRVRIDNEISGQSTVIEIQTQDRLGLGYHIAKTLANLGLNIVSAKLSTEGNHTFDVYYVQNREGEKITSSYQMTEIMEELRFQLEALKGSGG